MTSGCYSVAASRINGSCRLIGQLMSVKMNLLLVYIVCLARFEFAIESDLCKNISDVQTDLDRLSDAPVSRIQLIVTQLII